MYLCYIDESGTPDIPGNTSHFILAGVTIPIWHWKDADRAVSDTLARYALEGEELHTAWLMRPYVEQSKILNFDQMSHLFRRSAVQRARNTNLLALQKGRNRKAYLQTKKNYERTNAYIHLTYDERVQMVNDVAEKIARWGFARLFADCIDKLHFDPNRTSRTIEEQAFEQVVSRFDRYLSNISPADGDKRYGLLVHDNNQTVARKHTRLMRDFHRQGTLWRTISHIIETPMFVDSALTSMVQVADLCAYALRRYVENQETGLFNKIFARADRMAGATVGVRHFTGSNCSCQICVSHVPAPPFSG